MKRGALLRHLPAQGCQLLRRGARHSWWQNPNQNKRSAIPRHTEIGEEAQDQLQGDSHAANDLLGGITMRPIRLITMTEMRRRTTRRRRGRR